MTQDRIVNSAEACVDRILEVLGKDIRLGMNLGIGKPNHTVNALYRRAKADKSISLKIFTALSLEYPKGSSKLESNFLGPFAERVFGGYEDLEYMLDIRAKKLPPNVDVYEIFLKSGGFKKEDYVQQNYISANYTHIAGAMVDNKVNLLGLALSRREQDGKVEYSMSSNPEVAPLVLPVMKEMKAKGVPIMAFGEVNENMPFMVNDAIIEAEELDCIVEDKACNTRLFAPPYMAVLTTDYMIGLNASSLVRDGGTLQIGIGSLGDACAYALELRESDNAIYNEVLADIGAREKWGDLIDEIGGTDTFSEGLYGCSEMFVSGFMELMKANIVRRPVWDDIGLQRLINDKKVNPQSINADILDMLLEAGSINNPLTEANVAMLGKYGILKGNPTLKGEAIVTADGTHYGNNIEELRAIVGDKLIGGIIMHGGFFLGCNDFYDDLRSLTPEQNASINMTSIGFVNHLYGDEALKLVQRRDFRMINTCFTATALGAAVSDQTEDGKMVSGVGGQYNFVSMAHEMPDGRSIMMCKSSRGSSASNIVWKYGHTTIPRHLRDIFVTEYGVVNVRNMPDKDVIAKMLNISDSRFQQALMDEAKAAGKLPANYQIPELYRQNTPQKLESILNKYRAKDKFPPFPFGCELTEQELIIGRALKVLKAKSTGPKVPFLKQVLRALMYTPTAEVQPFLDRMKGDTLSKVEKGLLAMEVQAVLASKK